MVAYKETYASRIGKKLGMQDIQLFNESFDNNVILKGNNEDFVRRIFSESIQRLCLKSIPPQQFYEQESSDYKPGF
jgi:hypothetical protein